MQLRILVISRNLLTSFHYSAQTHELKTQLAGQIARAAAVFCIDEIVVFNDGQSQKQQKPDRRVFTKPHEQSDSWGEDYSGWSDPDYFLYHVLTYLETPPHLRKHLFPMHADLRTAGALPSLDMPHHIRASEWCQYREGVTVGPANNKAGYGKKKSDTPGTNVEAGLGQYVRVSDEIPEKTRVTLKFREHDFPASLDDLFDPEAVTPAAPREEAGYYWGYTTRMASKLSEVFTQSPFEDGYDVSIGTSERGVSLSSVIPSDVGGLSPDDSKALPPFKHLLIVFGGVSGLEAALDHDTELKSRGVQKENIGELFDAWVNVLPGQGSRTIRTEEAVWLGLMGLREYALKKGE